MLQLSQRALSASEMDGKLFVDRSDELAAIKRALALGFNVYLTGAAGSGKTSLLHRIEAETDRAVFINAARAESFQDLMAQLAHDLRRSGLPNNPDLNLRENRIADALVALRAAAQEHSGGTVRPVVLLDGLNATLRHDLFGRYRDEVQQIPLLWVVAGRGSLDPPADTFFETSIALQPFAGAQIAELLRRRAAEGTHEERARLDKLAEAFALLLSPATPRTVLSTARSVLLSPDPDAAVDEIRRSRNALVHASPTAHRVFDALVAIGPTHAGDQRLLTEIGTTRSRIVQVLRELEEAGLVVSAPKGRRKIYGADLGTDLLVEDPETGEIVEIQVKRRQSS